MGARIRLATPGDAGAMAAIYEPYVRQTAISFEIEPPDADEMRQRIVNVLAWYPWLVCENHAGEVVGYAYGSRHAERLAYRWSADVTVYVSALAQRCGVGRGLYTSLFQLLRLQGYYMAYAGVTLPNDGSIGLHTAMDFKMIGVYENVGFKLGKWHPVAYLGLELQERPAVPEEPKLPEELALDARWISAIEAGRDCVRL